MNKEEFENKLKEFIDALKQKKHEEEKEDDEITLNDVIGFLDSQDGHLVNLLRWAPIIEDMSRELNNCGQDQELVVKLRMIYSQMVREIGERTLLILGYKND